MKTIKLFDYCINFPINNESLSKIIDFTFFSKNASLFLNDTKRDFVTKEIITEKFNKYKNEKFFFKISDEYTTFFSNLGIEDENCFIFPNPFFDTTYLDFELYFAVKEIGENFYIINNAELEKYTNEWDLKSLIDFIKSAEVNVEYLIEKAISLNNYALEEYKEGYLPKFNEMAQIKLAEIKK